MSYAIQCCTRCGALEHGHTGPADRYLCSSCYREGNRIDGVGNLYQVERYRVHTWNLERREWEAAPPALEARDPRTAYLEAKQRHPGKTVHVARVLVEPCSPGERAHA
jgi:hypothetical protein